MKDLFLNKYYSVNTDFLCGLEKRESIQPYERILAF